MSKTGAPVLTSPSGAGGFRVAVISASWHEEIIAALHGGVERALTEAGITQVIRVDVPGTFELPVAASRIAPHVDAIIALGVVIRGSTPHFEYVCQAATGGLTDVSVRSGVPVGFGVLTCDDEHQARERSGVPGAPEDKGYEAAVAALRTALALREYTQ
ncbi:MAG: 6,7-dimethyl-8-ribityllumazine synthase [Actinomycetota bacterium]